MEFRLLGLVEVVARERPVDLGHRRQRLVLAVLALEANRLVPIDRLVGLSWPGSPPRTAVHAIRVAASQLRTALARADSGQHRVELVGRDSGYMLRADAMDIDAHRFRSLLRQARTTAGDERKIALLRQALGLWRGPVLTGIAPDETRDALGRGLEEARLVALEDRIDAELRLARHRELLDELTGLVEAHPLRERLTAQLMLALYWSGQAGAALEAFHRTRRRFAEELGIDPGAELRRLEMGMLRNDAALAAPPGPPGLPAPHGTGPADGRAAPPEHGWHLIMTRTATPAQLPPTVPDFTGRAAELRALTELSQERGEPAPTATIIAITGPAGVGKTALAVRWAQLNRRRFGDGQLFIDLRGYACGPPVSAAVALGRFLRAVGTVRGEVPDDPDEAAALYRTLLADRQMLIVIDNAAAARQVRPLLPAAHGCLVIVTSRDRLTGLMARDGARSLGLDTLPPDEARSLLARVLRGCWAGAETAEADRVARACGYLPLALRVAAANLASCPQVSISGCAARLSQHDALAALQVCGDEQATLSAVLGLSYARLGPDARRLFRLSGVAPCQDLTARTAAVLAGIPDRQARRLLDQLASAHMLREHIAGRFTLSEIFRSYARQLARDEDGERECAAAVLRLVKMYAATAAAARHGTSTRPGRLPAATLAGFTGASDAATWLADECVNLASVRSYAAEHGLRALTRQLANPGPGRLEEICLPAAGKQERAPAMEAPAIVAPAIGLETLTARGVVAG